MLQNLNSRAVLLKSIARGRGRRDSGSKLQGKQKDIITDAIVLLASLAHTFYPKITLPYKAGLIFFNMAQRCCRWQISTLLHLLISKQ